MSGNRSATLGRAQKVLQHRAKIAKIEEQQRKLRTEKAVRKAELAEIRKGRG